MSWAWKQEVPPSAKIVLLAIADHADPYGGNAYPSQATLARKTGYNERTVKRLVDSLVAAGALRVSVNGGHSSTRADRRPNLYQMLMDEPIAMSRSEMGKSSGAGPALRREVIAAFYETCHWCRGEGDAKNGPDGAAWEVDRVVSGASGGQYVRENVVLSCRTCNLGRREDITPSREVQREVKMTPTGGQDSPNGGSALSREPPLTIQEPPLATSAKKPLSPKAVFARELVAEWWESTPNKPATSFLAIVKLIEPLPARGWTRSEIRQALRETSSFTGPSLDMWRNKRRAKTTAQEGADADAQALDEVEQAIENGNAELAWRLVRQKAVVRGDVWFDQAAEHLSKGRDPDIVQAAVKRNGKRLSRDEVGQVVALHATIIERCALNAPRQLERPTT